MSSFRPFEAIHVRGSAVIRGSTVAIDSRDVLNSLPAGLELGDQTLTPSGTHPVLFLFNRMYGVEPSIPSPLAPMSYHEHRVLVPFAYLSKTSITPGAPGPYCFMPRLYLDNAWAMLGSLVFQGVLKEMAQFHVAQSEYTVSDSTGRVFTSLTWRAGKDDSFRPLSQYPNFEPVRQMLSQPLISGGPVFLIHSFEKAWDLALMRPLRTLLFSPVSYVQGYAAGSMTAPGIDASPAGSYELRTAWQLGSPCPPLFFNLQRSFFSKSWYG